MKLPNLRSELRVFGAPLAGVSDTAFRKLIKRYGADYCFTEMVSSEGLVRDHARTLDYLRKYDGETAVGAQLFGTKPDVVAEAAQVVESLGFD
jgi:tRNA-dihydrouridine synthase B